MKSSGALDVAVIGLSCVDLAADASSCRWNMMNPVGNMRISGGGIGNALLALSGLGLRIGAATRIGVDFYGDYLLRLWDGLGVDCAAVTRDPRLPTGLAFLVNHGTERTPFFSAGANRAFCREDVPASMCTDSGCVLIFFAGALPSFDGDGMRDFVATCHGAGTPVILDVSDSTAGDYTALESYLPFVNLVVNSEEGYRLTGKRSSVEVVRSLAEMAGGAHPEDGFRAATRSDGVSVIAFTKKGVFEADVISPFYGRPIRTSVGAGDAFRAGLASYLCAHRQTRQEGNLDLRAACLYACAVSYLYLARTTDTRPPFSAADVRALLNR